MSTMLLLLLACSQVVYPGLTSHPQHELMARLMNPGYGFGGLMGLDMGNPACGEAVSDRGGPSNRHRPWAVMASGIHNV